MRPVSIISELTGVTSNVEASEVTLTSPSVVKLQLERSDIASITRTGQDMVIKLNSGETITLKNFYVENSQGANHLVLEDSHGALWWVENPGEGLHFQQIDNLDGFMIADGHSEGGAIWPWVLGGVAVAAGIGIAAGGGGGGGGGSDNKSSGGDNGSGNGNNGNGNGNGNNGNGNGNNGNGNGNNGNGNGNGDTTPPNAPTNLAVSADGKTVTGNAEPGSTVEVKDPNGTVIGKGTADSSGHFSIGVTPSQLDGEKLTVDATDKAGNTGPSASVTAPNVALPETPVITSAVDDHTSAPLSNNQYTNDNTPILKGTGTVGSTVHIFSDGHLLGSAVVGSNGTWSFSITSPLSEGAHSFTAIAFNIKGHSIESTHFNLTVDTVAPDAPQLTGVNDDVGSIVGNLQNGSVTDDAKPVFSGKGEVGDTITVRDGQTVLGTTTVDANGNWTFTPSQPLSETSHTITITQTDKAGNVSQVTTAPTFTVDTTPPAPAHISTVSENGATVTGTAEAGSTVTIYDGNNVLLGTALVGNDGQFTITLNPAKTHGEPLEARIQDAAGNVGQPTDFDASNSGFPSQPVIVTINDNVDPVQGNVSAGGFTNDNTPTLSGTAEPNAFITVSDKGVILAPVVQADASGNWSFTPIPALADGDHIFTATANNGTGTSAPSASVTINVDIQIPVLDHVAVANQGQTVTGHTEVGSTVVVKDAQGTQLGTGTADQNGNFSITLSSPKTNGETLIVSVTDRAANVGIPDTIVAPDTTPPAAPTGLQVTADGMNVIGQAEPGSIVTITDSSDHVLGTAQTNPSGNFIVPLDTPQLNGQGLLATAADAAHNVSQPSSVVAPDKTAPDAPDHLLVNGTGTQLTGHAEPGSTVTVKDPEGHVIGTGKASSTDGQFTITLAPAQDNGEHLSATATDLAGNVSAPGYADAPDITAPDQPVILDVVDDAPEILGSVLDGKTTNDATPTLSGTAEIGSTVTVLDNGTPLGTATMDASGNWTFTPSPPLSEGSHQFTVISTDAAGNASTASAPWTIVVDTVAPQVPAITLVNDDAPALIGAVANGGLTNDSTPTVSGTGQPGSTVHLMDNGSPVADITVSPSGTWSYTFTTPLTGPNHSLTVNASDNVGNTSADSSAWTFTLDTTPPGAPVMVVTDTGGIVLDSGDLTNDTKPGLTGTTEIGSTVTIYDNGKELGQATVDASGNWTFTLPVGFGDGPHVLTANATDAAGNVSPDATFTLNVDATAPDAPQVISATIILETDPVPLANGSITNQTEPVLNGTSEANATVTLYNNGNPIATVQADDQGNWSYPLDTPLIPGLNVITATATDAAGNVSPPSGVFSITIDLVAPTTPVAPLVADNEAPVVGYVANNGFTNDTTPTFSGTGEVGSTITLYNGVTYLGSTVVNQSGTWTFTPSSPLTNGTTYSITTTETDLAGNISQPSPAAVFTVDTTVPDAPLISYAADDVGAEQSNVLNNGATDDNLPVLHGTAEAGSTVAIYNGLTLVGTAVADGGGNWSLAITTPLADGTYTFTAVATDKAGNVGGTSPTFTIDVETTILPPTVTEILDDKGPVTGPVITGTFTDDQTLLITGTGEDGTTVIIYDHGSQIGTALVTGGTWSYTTSALTEGSHSLTFTAKDAAGNETTPDTPVTFTVDITPPDAPTVNPPLDGVTVTGTAEANATVFIKDAEGNVIGTGLASPTGDYTVILTTPQVAGENLVAIAQDQAGNQSPGTTFSAFNEGDLPNAPVIVTVDDDIGSIQGHIAANGSTDDTTPTLSGTAEKDSTVHIYVNGGTTEIGNALVDGSGNWTFTVPAGLAFGEGSYTFTATATNETGTGSSSAPFTINVDLSAPVAPTILTATDDVPGNVGTIGSGTLTNDARPTLNGISEPGSTVTIFDNGIKIGTTTATAGGTWSFTPSSDLDSISHVFTATATDAAGNTNGVSNSFTLNIDAVAPGTPAITYVANDNGSQPIVLTAGQATNDTQPLLKGSAEAGSTVSVYDGTTLLGTTVADGSGNWTFTFPIGTTLSNGNHSLTVTAMDAAGNTSLPSSAFPIVIDTLAPATPTLLVVADNQPGIVGPLVSGQMTNDTEPTLSGRGEAGATITIFSDGNPVGTGVVDPTGTWLVRLTTPLTDGPHVLTVNQTDPAGNVSASTSGFTVNVDASAPGAPIITAVGDNTAPVIGVVPNGGSTNETHPTISGTGEIGSTITLYNGSTVLGTTTVNALGNWTFTPSTALTPGTWNITATATDTAGNTGVASDVRTFTVDTSAPNAPAITTVFDDQGPSTGNLSNGSVTDDTRPAISGTSEPNATIKLYDNGNPLATVTADGTGAWSYTPTADMAQGNHVITATAADAAGNLSAASGSFSFVVDSLAPLAPVITSLTDDVAPVVGPVLINGTTNDNTPTLSGTAEAGATVRIYDTNNVLVGTTTANASGNWTVTTSTLGDGPHSLTAKATDAAGNISTSSQPFGFTVDTAIPVAPTLTSVTDDVAGGALGALTNGQLTNDNLPTLTGTAEAGSTVSIYDGSTLLGTTVATGGTWTFTPGTALADGSHTLTVTATDAGGNISQPTTGFTIVVDATAPVTPVITNIVDDVPNIVGNVGNGQFTNDSLPTLNGTAEANSTVRIYDGATLVTTVTANASGAWTWTPTTALSQGVHTWTVTSTDAAGNLSATSTAAGIIVDTVAPGAPSGLTMNGTGTRVTGSAEANSTVTITSATGTVLGTATADGTGAFTVTISPAQTTGQALLAFAQDRAGNVGVSVGFTAPDTRVPDAPTITSVVDDVAGGAVGQLTSGQLTNDAMPTLSGTAQANSTVTIYNNGVAVGTTTANGSGAWTFTPPANVTEGAHAFTATASNANGAGSPSAPFSVIVDTTAPAAPGIAISADGSVLSGTAEANSTITITLPNGGGTLTTTAGSNGSWSLTLPVRQIDGLSISATATDVAGNTSGPNSVLSPNLPLSANDNITNLALTSDATTTTEHLTDYGLLLVGALGNVASVLGNDTAQVQFSIANGGSGDVTIDAAATGIVLSLLSTQEIVIQKYDTASGSWQTFINTGVGDFANLLTLTGSGVRISLTGLTGGDYRVLTYNTSLLATGSYTSLDVDVQKTSAGTVSGTTSHIGNVITDQDAGGGQDNAPTGTLLTKVTNANGDSVTVGAGGADIVGLYGTLHINQNGSYTYTLTNTSAAVLGHKDSFTYTITQGGISDSAQLVVTLGPTPPASSVVAADNSASLVFDTDVTSINNGASSQSGFTVVGVGLGSVLSLDVLANMSNPIKFDVEDGSTRTMTLQSSVGGVALASTFDLYIYRFNDLTQQYEQYKVQKGWLNAPLLGGQSSQLTLTLPGGEYLFLLNTASGVTALTGYTLNILQDHTYAVDSITASTTGNVLTNDVVPADAHITDVNGVAVSATGTTTINGLYGTLTIDAKGNYTYTLKSGVGADSISTPDSFVYTVKAANGDTDSASLNITPTPQVLNAVDDNSAVMAFTTVQDTVALPSTNVGQAKWNTALLSGTSGSGSGTFVVDPNSVLKGATLHFDVASGLALGGLSVGWTLTLNGNTVANGNFSGSALLGNSIDVALTGKELLAGTYTLTVNGSIGALSLGTVTITPSISGTTYHLDTFDSNTANVHGNIFDGTDAAGALDQLSTVHTTLTVNGFGGSSGTLNPTGSTSSMTIQGHYGTLTMNLDGSYTYALKAGVTVASMTSKETFTYTLNDQNGHTDTATLTINMNPQIASTNQHDVINGSAYGDTLIYHMLNTADATGGNNSDNWTNFSLAQGDKIDLRELLTGWDHQASTLGNFVKVTTNGTDTVIAIDRDGTGSTYNSTTLITLNNVHTTFDELVQQNHIITG